MISRKYYESKFNSYPDLVVLKEMRKMLGGITERNALDLLHSKQIKAFYIEQRYLIPKICIIDYLINGNKSPVDDKPPKKPVRSRKPGNSMDVLVSFMMDKADEYVASGQNKINPTKDVR